MALKQEEVDAFLSNLLNYTAESKAGDMFAKALLTEHRTLQSTFWRIMHDKVIPMYAESASDLRNQNAVAYALKLQRAGEDTYLPRI